MKRFLTVASVGILLAVVFLTIRLCIDLAVALLPPTNAPEDPRDHRANVGYVAGVVLCIYVGSRKSVMRLWL